MNKQGRMWGDVDEKHEKFYIPILRAFKDELMRLYTANNSEIASNLLSCLIGSHDFYKIIKDNGMVSVQSFNILGSLKWGSKILSPTRIVEVSLKKDSRTTLMAIFDKGWQISFRIHNASSKVETSLGLDIQIVG